MNSVRDASAFAVDESPRKDEVNRDRRALFAPSSNRGVSTPAPRDAATQSRRHPAGCHVPSENERNVDDDGDDDDGEGEGESSARSSGRVIPHAPHRRATGGVEQGTRLACPVFRRNRLRGLGGRSRRVRGETGTRARRCRRRCAGAGAGVGGNLGATRSRRRDRRSRDTWDRSRTYP